MLSGPGNQAAGTKGDRDFEHTVSGGPVWQYRGTCAVVHQQPAGDGGLHRAGRQGDPAPPEAQAQVLTMRSQTLPAGVHYREWRQQQIQQQVGLPSLPRLAPHALCLPRVCVHGDRGGQREGEREGGVGGGRG